MDYNVLLLICETCLDIWINVIINFFTYMSLSYLPGDCLFTFVTYQKPKDKCMEIITLK